MGLWYFSATMPGQLKILLGMYGVNVVLNAIQMSWVGLVISLIVMALLFKGNNVVRIVVIVLAVLGLIFGAIGALGLGALLAVAGGEFILPLLQIVWGLIVNVFAIFALTRAEVKAHFGVTA